MQQLITLLHNSIGTVHALPLSVTEHLQDVTTCPRRLASRYQHGPPTLASGSQANVVSKHLLEKHRTTRLNRRRVVEEEPEGKAPRDYL